MLIYKSKLFYRAYIVLIREQIITLFILYQWIKHNSMNLCAAMCVYIYTYSLVPIFRVIATFFSSPKFLFKWEIVWVRLVMGFNLKRRSSHLRLPNDLENSRTFYFCIYAVRLTALVSALGLYLATKST